MPGQVVKSLGLGKLSKHALKGSAGGGGMGGARSRQRVYRWRSACLKKVSGTEAGKRETFFPRKIERLARRQRYSPGVGAIPASFLE